MNLRQVLASGAVALVTPAVSLLGAPAAVAAATPKSPITARLSLPAKLGLGGGAARFTIAVDNSNGPEYRAATLVLDLTAKSKLIGAFQAQDFKLAYEGTPVAVAGLAGGIVRAEVTGLAIPAGRSTALNFTIATALPGTGGATTDPAEARSAVTAKAEALAAKAIGNPPATKPPTPPPVVSRPDAKAPPPPADEDRCPLPAASTGELTAAATLTAAPGAPGAPGKFGAVETLASARDTAVLGLPTVSLPSGSADFASGIAPQPVKITVNNDTASPYEWVMPVLAFARPDMTGGDFLVTSGGERAETLSDADERLVLAPIGEDGMKLSARESRTIEVDVAFAQDVTPGFGKLASWAGTDGGFTNLACEGFTVATTATGQKAPSRPNVDTREAGRGQSTVRAWMSLAGTPLLIAGVGAFVVFRRRKGLSMRRMGGPG